jgi:hypothetical protein
MRAGHLLKFNHDDRPLRVKGTALRSSHGGFRFYERNWFGHIVFQKDQVRGMTYFNPLPQSLLSEAQSLRAGGRQGREANFALAWNFLNCQNLVDYTGDVGGCKETI